MVASVQLRCHIRPTHSSWGSGKHGKERERGTNDGFIVCVVCFYISVRTRKILSVCLIEVENYFLRISLYPCCHWKVKQQFNDVQPLKLFLRGYICDRSQCSQCVLSVCIIASLKLTQSRSVRCSTCQFRNLRKLWASIKI